MSTSLAKLLFRVIASTHGFPATIPSSFHLSAFPTRSLLVYSDAIPTLMGS